MCPDCIAGKHTHFGSHSGLPEVTVPGEIVAFELLILRTPDAYTNGTIIFGAIDLHSDWDLIIKIKFKTDVPECVSSRRTGMTCGGCTPTERRSFIRTQHIMRSSQKWTA